MTTEEIKNKRREKKLLKKAFFAGNCASRSLMDKENEILNKEFVQWYKAWNLE